ncbi:MAG: ATP-binding cassette domain-containing protein, partial [Gloeobacteraceae cyanobacterium ES-bin-144]|nr:ATP-binding cassette domain-containing protein [Verrucomicrobiales bacterium]
QPKPIGRERVLRWLRAIPGIGRLRALRTGADAQVGVIVDAFASFATLDGELSALEGDLILDMLRSAFPEVDHGWLGRRLQRAVRNPQPLQSLALELKNTYDDPAKLALGLQLFTLVDASSRSERNRASFEVFMRRLGQPAYGSAILREMRSDLSEPDDSELPFERLIFGSGGANVVLPLAAIDYEFRVYRTKDLILVRNTGIAPLWIRGRSVETGSFLRMRERQPLVVPGWTLSFEDLMFFLDVKRTGNAPAIYLESGETGLTAERTMGRNSALRVRFGLEATVEALRDTNLHAGSRGPLAKGDIVTCRNHERLGDESGFSLSINELRRKATQSGRRFRLAGDRQEYLVSNDASALSRGDLLLGTKLSPKTVLFIRYDAQKAEGELQIRESNGPILVDGAPVKLTASLRDGSLIRLSGSQAVRCRFREGFLDEERTLIESLRVEDLIHDFAPDARALDHINFEVKRGEMLCIIGPSGSGKSTLLAVLSGQREPTRGIVELNGISLYERREHLVPFIAHMPQEEALNPQLTVREHLRHAVTIRRPALSLAEHERRVDSILAELGLQSIARRQVGSAGDKSLSGGERSRLNLGVDLGSRAEVFLFDEPISGLSSKDSEHVAETLRSLAREKIVIASLHRPGAQVLRLFDKVLLLDSGGRLAFFGTPAAMVGYFRDACDELGITHPSVTAKSPLGADFVFDVLETPLSAIGGGSNTGAARRFPPTFWQERFESADLMLALQTGGGPISKLGEAKKTTQLPLPPKPSRRFHAVIAVFATHFLRSFLSKFRNRGTVYSTCLEAPLLAALISNTLRASPDGPYSFATALHIPAYLFLSTTVAMFLGLTNSATEVLRDRPILRRERNCQPGAASYVAAKFVALGLVAAVQSFAYLIVGNHFLEIEGMLFYHWMWMTLTALTGTGLAMVVSSIVKTERAALTSVPLLLVPQMLLAGALVPYREMNRGLFIQAAETRERGGMPVPAVVMPLRYAYEAMVVCQAVRNPFEIERIRLQRKIDRVREPDRQMNTKELERFDLAKEGLRRLLASGASTKEEAADIVSRIRKTANSGTSIELESVKLWPDHDPKASPAYEYFVNNRIDLIVREAETFRNDYRRSDSRVVFCALQKPFPWATKNEPTSKFGEPSDEIETQKYCAFILFSIVIICGIISTLIISKQNRQTH